MAAPGNLSIMNTWVVNNMRKRLKKLLVRYEFLFGFGLLIAILSLCNVIGYTSINSDLFWTFAGLEIALVSAIELYYVWIENEADNQSDIAHAIMQDETDLSKLEYVNPHEVRWGDDH